MTYRIKRITNAGKPRAYVTIEELDVQSNPISGRVWTEPFDTVKKDWTQLKQRFKKRIATSDAEGTAENDLITEGNNAGITSIS